MPDTETFDTVVDALYARGRNRRDRLAFSYDDVPLTFGHLCDQATWLARRFRGAGLGYGARCVVMLPSGLDFIRAIYATQTLGAVPVAVDPSLTASGRHVRVTTVDPHLVVTTAERLEQTAHAHPGVTVITLEGARDLPDTPSVSDEAPGPDDIAYLQFTSGTSGTPRACIVDHRALMASLRGMQRRYDITGEDVMANWLPLHYASGLVRHVFGTVAYGSPSHLIAPSAAATARWLPLITQVRATVTTAPDSAYRLATQLVNAADVDLRSLRFAGSGGEPVRADTIRGFEQRFGLSRVVQPAYGLSEGTLAIAANPPGAELTADDVGAVSCGTAIDGIELRVVDGTGAPVPSATMGELQFRGSTLFRGYFNDDAGTRAVVRPDGWCQPGDRAVLDADGRLFVRARTRALIKRGGVGIAPREVEEPVGKLPGVIACAAVGASRATRSTEDLVVVVEAHRTVADPRALIDRVQRASVEAVRVLPAAVFIVEAGTLPRSAAGKIQYADVRARVEGAGFGSATLAEG